MQTSERLASDPWEKYDSWRKEFLSLFFFYSKPINFLQINQDDFNLINTQPINTYNPWINRITCISWNKLNNKYTASFMYLLLGY